MKRRNFALAAVALCAGLSALSLPALADSWPSKPVTVIVPFPAGGGTDAFAKPLAAQLSKQLGQPFLVENKGGAGGTVGAGVAARAAGDGYTLFIGGAHHAIAPSLYKRLAYDIDRDFSPITVIAQPPQVIVVNPGRVQAKTLGELLAQVKASPGRVTYASAGNGSSHHLAGELFAMQTGSQLSHVPYKGAGPALADLVAGQVDMMFDGLGSSSKAIREGKVKALAVAASKRSAAFPNVPTAAEAGVPGFEVSTWYAMWVPKNTPKDVQARIYAEVQKALNSPELREQWLAAGSETPRYTPEQLSKLFSSDARRWAQVVEKSGAKLD